MDHKLEEFQLQRKGNEDSLKDFKERNHRVRLHFRKTTLAIGWKTKKMGTSLEPDDHLVQRGWGRGPGEQAVAVEGERHRLKRHFKGRLVRTW